MRLIRFKPTAEYAPGKTLTVADTLSRSPLLCLEKEADTRMWSVTLQPLFDNMPAPLHRLESVRTVTAADSNLHLV